MSEEQTTDSELPTTELDEMDLQRDTCELDATLLQAALSAANERIEQLEYENSEQKAQIDRLQKDRIRKSVLLQAPLVSIIEEPSAKEDDDKDGNDQSTKIEQFFKQFNTENVTSAQLCVHGINSLVSLHHTLFAKSENEQFEDNQTTQKAAKLAFNYVLEFVRQLNARQIDTKTQPDLSYPINWLLSLFPYNISNDKNAKSKSEEVSDFLWMPLHFSLALDSSSETFDRDSYLADLELLLEEFGHAAFEEDVSPLSIAVSTARPNLEAVKLILEYRPDCVRKTDEDGSLPLMHACANNVTLDIIEFLYREYPEAVKLTDSFGCAAIHYAAFYGCPETVTFLLEVDPACANMVEGNGALPLHDAVQNQRAFGSTEMVQILLQANPLAARKRDDYGAFPLHKAAKSATLSVVQMIHKAFPKAMFGPDIEGLLPMHYYAERHDKDQHLDVLQYVLQANPQSSVLDDTALFAADPDPAAAGSGATAGGWRGAMRAMWGGGSAATVTKSAQQAPAAASPPPPPPSVSVSSPKFGNSPGKGAPPVGHNKRKSVRPVRGSIHEQYKR